MDVRHELECYFSNGDSGISNSVRVEVNVMLCSVCAAETQARPRLAQVCVKVRQAPDSL